MLCKHGDAAYVPDGVGILPKCTAEGTARAGFRARL